MLGIIFAVIAAAGQGLGYALIKKSNYELAPSIAYFIDAIFGILIWVPFALLIGVEFNQLDVIFPVALLSAVFGEAYVIYVYSKGQFGATTAIFALYPVFTIIFSRFINNEQLTFALFIACIITIIGAIITAVPHKFTKVLLREKLFVIWPFSAAILVGFTDTVSKRFIDQVDATTFLFALAFAQVPVALIYLWLEKTNRPSMKKLIIERYTYRYALAGAFLVVATLIAFWLAYEYTLASIASTVTNGYVAFSVIGAYFILHERFSQKDKLGIATTLAGILMIGYFSVN
jgi:drug/metabolite transporter (DMT)-like permease